MYGFRNHPLIVSDKGVDLKVLVAFTRWSSRALNWVAVCSLLGMMSLTCAEVILRRLGHPILGAYEIVGFLGAIVSGLAMAQTTIERGHVAVQVLVARFHPNVQKCIYLFGHLLSILLFALLFLECLRYGNDLRVSGEVSLTLRIPYYPIVYGIAISAAVVCLVHLVDILFVMLNRERAWFQWRD